MKIAKARSRHRRVSTLLSGIEAPEMRTPFSRMPLKNDVALGEAAPNPHKDPLGIFPRYTPLSKKEQKKRKRKRAALQGRIKILERKLNKLNKLNEQLEAM